MSAHNLTTATPQWPDRPPQTLSAIQQRAHDRDANPEKDPCHKAHMLFNGACPHTKKADQCCGVNDKPHRPASKRVTLTLRQLHTWLCSHNIPKGVPGATPMCLGASAKSAKSCCPPTHTANKREATQPAADYHTMRCTASRQAGAPDLGCSPARQPHQGPKAINQGHPCHFCLQQSVKTPLLDVSGHNTNWKDSVSTAQACAAAQPCHGKTAQRSHPQNPGCLHCHDAQRMLPFSFAARHQDAKAIKQL